MKVIKNLIIMIIIKIILTKMKKPKKKYKYYILDKEFDTFSKMKTFAYFNLVVDEPTEATKVFKDTIQATYILTKSKRRLRIEKTYDEEEKQLKRIEKLQLKLF